MTTTRTPRSGPDLRAVGDAPADAAVLEYLATQPALDPRHLVGRLIATADPCTAETPTPQLTALLGAGVDALPPWRDQALLTRGQRFFEANGLPIATALFCASLPTAYLSADGAQVIAITGDLVSNTHRRVAETAQLLTAVMDLGDQDEGIPLAPDTPGFRAAIGVRLMHASVRAFIASDPQASDRYQAPATEVPINQEDLTGTLLTFTTVVFRALERMGLDIDPLDAEAYLHTWCVVGHLLGIRPDLLPLDLAQASELDEAIRCRQTRTSDDGIALMGALRREMQANMPPGLRRFPDALVHEFIGTDAAASLGIPPPGWTRVLFLAGRAGARLWSHAPGRSARSFVGRAFARRMIRSYIDRDRGGSRPPWDYARYATSWKLDPLRRRVQRQARSQRTRWTDRRRSEPTGPTTETR